MATFDEKQTVVKRLAGSLASNYRGGTAIASTDVTLSGFGTGASVSAVKSGSTDTRGAFTVTAGSTPSANPTATLTFKDGAFEAAPFAVACRGAGTAADLGMTATISSTTTTTAVIKMIGTPTDTNTYEFYYWVCG